MRRTLHFVAAACLVTAASGCYLTCGICDCDPPRQQYGLAYGNIGAVPPGAHMAAPIVEASNAGTPAKTMPLADR